MRMVLALLAVGVGTRPNWPMLQQDGYSLTPPEGFRAVKLDLFRGTQAGSVLLSARASGVLSAALVQGDGVEASAMLVALVDESFEATPSMRDDFAAATVHHLTQDLALDFHIDSARRVGGPAPRIEVLGHAKREAQLRYFLIAAIEGEGHHAVVTFSIPSSGWSAFEPRIEASLETFRAEPRPGESWRRIALITTALTVVALLVAFRIRRSGPESRPPS